MNTLALTDNARPSASAAMCPAGRKSHHRERQEQGEEDVVVASADDVEDTTGLSPIIAAAKTARSGRVASRSGDDGHRGEARGGRGHLEPVDQDPGCSS